jgi:hypothetical protein
LAEVGEHGVEDALVEGRGGGVVEVDAIHGFIVANGDAPQMLGTRRRIGADGCQRIRGADKRIAVRLVGAILCRLGGLQKERSRGCP